MTPSTAKNQRFIFGTRLADHALDIRELLVESAYRSEKAVLLSRANRKIETLRWLIRLANSLRGLTRMALRYSQSLSPSCV